MKYIFLLPLIFFVFLINGVSQQRLTEVESGSNQVELIMHTYDGIDYHIGILPGGDIQVYKNTNESELTLLDVINFDFQILPRQVISAAGNLVIFYKNRYCIYSLNDKIKLTGTFDNHLSNTEAQKESLCTEDNIIVNLFNWDKSKTQYFILSFDDGHLTPLNVGENKIVYRFENNIQLLHENNNSDYENSVLNLETGHISNYLSTYYTDQFKMFKNWKIYIDNNFNIKYEINDQKFDTGIKVKYVAFEEFNIDNNIVYYEEKIDTGYLIHTHNLESKTYKKITIQSNYQYRTGSLKFYNDSIFILTLRNKNLLIGSINTSSFKIIPFNINEDYFMLKDKGIVYSLAQHIYFYDLSEDVNYKFDSVFEKEFFRINVSNNSTSTHLQILDSKKKSSAIIKLDFNQFKCEIVKVFEIGESGIESPISLFNINGKIVVYDYNNLYSIRDFKLNIINTKPLAINPVLDTINGKAKLLFFQDENDQFELVMFDGEVLSTLGTLSNFIGIKELDVFNDKLYFISQTDEFWEWDFNNNKFYLISDQINESKPRFIEHNNSILYGKKGEIYKWQNKENFKIFNSGYSFASCFKLNENIYVLDRKVYKIDPSNEDRILEEYNFWFDHVKYFSATQINKKGLLLDVSTSIRKLIYFSEDFQRIIGSDEWGCGGDFSSEKILLRNCDIKGEYQIYDIPNDSFHYVVTSIKESNLNLVEIEGNAFTLEQIWIMNGYELILNNLNGGVLPQNIYSEGGLFRLTDNIIEFGDLSVLIIGDLFTTIDGDGFWKTKSKIEVSTKCNKAITIDDNLYYYGWDEEYGTQVYKLTLEDLISTTDNVVASDLSYRIKPNPTSDYIFIQSQNPQKFEYKIFNGYGSVVAHGKTYNESKIDVQNLSTGVYYIQLNQNSKTHTEKFIKI